MEYDFTLTINVDGRVRQMTEGRHAAMCRRRLRVMTSSLSGSPVLQCKGLVLALPFANPVERRGRAIRKKEGKYNAIGAFRVVVSAVSGFRWHYSSAWRRDSHTQLHSMWEWRVGLPTFAVPRYCRPFRTPYFATAKPHPPRTVFVYHRRPHQCDRHHDWNINRK